ncbi:cytochrome c oxidase assembly protein [Sedimenticola hydrogenitrophicus]|uniref:cytochrome c oxidase assembly protein n=1 Tax=Sedimenticola hydrogenitrophicus TaxID=2967975 RepID=UPI0023AF0A1F|nr:cytochrome c oxidase assembly protein [Sedimenticola hydrogenitrophicus]
MTRSARQQSNRTLALKLAGITLAMFGFGFALVPLYEVFCEITGLNGKGVNRIVSAAATAVDDNRWVTVEFLSGSNLAGSWEFRPSQSRMRVQPGRLYSVSYQARNPTDQAVTVRAVSSIAPGTAAGYISKLECFCFRQQRFAPEEQRMMPVRFMVDRALPPELGTISIAYTLFDSLNREAAPGS